LAALTVLGQGYQIADGAIHEAYIAATVGDRFGRWLLEQR
jgi:hypothetical protein